MHNIEYIQSKKISDYKPLIDEFTKPELFGSAFKETVKHWCKKKNTTRKFKHRDQFWEVWLVREDNQSKAICGLYNICHAVNKDNHIEELWLGWFGVLNRSNGLGAKILNTFLKPKAKELGATYLMSYVNKNGAPIEFYKRHGFEVIGTVKDWILQKADGELKPSLVEHFEDIDDYVIRFKL